MALPLWAIMGGAGMLNEMTTGRQKQNQDSAYKQAMWRSKVWMPDLKPENVAVHQSDPMGAAIQGGISGYDMQNQISNNKIQKQQMLAGLDKTTSEKDANIERANAYKRIAMQKGIG